MNSSKLQAAILIVSDTAFDNPSTDSTKAILCETFEKAGQDRWTTPQSRIVPDDISSIRNTIQVWCDGEEAVNLVVTTGGTGFAVRDLTPEAVTPLIDRHAPGLM